MESFVHLRKGRTPQRMHADLLAYHLRFHDLAYDQHDKIQDYD